MRIPDEIKREILEYGARNIDTIIGEYLPLKKTGKTFSGCCPFHGEKTASFHVTPERGTWRCFGSCGEGGDVVSFMMKLEGISFHKALQKLANRAGIAIPGAGETAEEKERKAIFSALAKAEKFFKEALAADNSDGKAYVESRMTSEMVSEFGIGWAPANSGKHFYNNLEKLGISEELAMKAGLIRQNEENGTFYDVFRKGRVMFPIKNKNGYTIGFAGRRIDGESEFKYINSAETPVYKKYSVLYGLDKCDFSSGEVFVVEGYLDLMQMWAAGIRNVVAACSTAFTAEHIAVLKKYGVRRLNLMFDGDKAGIKATQKAITLAYTEEMKAMVYSLPEGKDPDDFFKSGKLEDLTSISGFEYLEQSGIELDGTMRELRRLERLEKAMLYFAQSPAVAAILKKRGNLEELFSQDALVQIQEVLQA